MSESWEDAKAYGFCNDLREELSEPTLRCIELEKENAELRAQLAGCRVMFSDLYDDMRADFTSEAFSSDGLLIDTLTTIMNILDSLPKTAALDAEISRCAEEQTRLAAIGGRASRVNYQNACIATCDAVRAREEATK